MTVHGMNCKHVLVKNKDRIITEIRNFSSLCTFQIGKYKFWSHEYSKMLRIIFKGNKIYDLQTCRGKNELKLSSKDIRRGEKHK